MRLRNRRRRGVTYVEVVVASAFVAICAATLADSLTFSTETISYVQRRAMVQAAMQGMISDVKGSALAALPANGTTISRVSLGGGRLATLTQTLTQVTGKNMTHVQVSASWPEMRGSRYFNDSLSFETYVRGPD